MAAMSAAATAVRLRLVLLAATGWHCWPAPAFQQMARRSMLGGGDLARVCRTSPRPLAGSGSVPPRRREATVSGA